MSLWRARLRSKAARQHIGVPYICGSSIPLMSRRQERYPARSQALPKLDRGMYHPLIRGSFTGVTTSQGDET